MEKLVNGLSLRLVRPVWAHLTRAEDGRLTGDAVLTTTDSAGNHARITGVLQYSYTRRGKINQARALVQMSDARHHTLYAWIDADQAEEESKS